MASGLSDDTAAMCRIRYAGEGSGSGSAAVAVRSSGHHVFEIRDYSILKAITPNTKCVKSGSSTPRSVSGRSRR
uniref:Uncharacterized protein OSJNBa0061K21.12 n=1 Tax=Oryza sativa TaxID=4530 RepID=Q8S865_ORYSA|nr:Hypothetical protein [Oryza sativa]